MTMSVSCRLLLYDDDSCLLVSHKDPEYIASKLSENMNNCSKWMVDNRLSLHLGKTEVILFGS